jgi:lipopolysaccharide transport system ATP-binding protein
MNDFALQADGLGKMYHIGAQREKYRTLRDTVVRAATRPIERIRHPGAATNVSAPFWALRHIDMAVKHGEVLGVIGGNGAGKSTLLKILSHITEPTEGRVEIWGRVRSLLEVGTGFHGELTGRENIYLNGAILGMSRAEIKSKFDEIVEFSEISRFLDTPVKRYSSGMYVRLAFAVAAHLEPEILLVDEVLAVGDAAFQKKCLGKMGEVASEGRTVLFVSHNMATVLALCSEVVWLDAGRIASRGGTKEIVGKYMESARSENIVPLVERKDRGGSGDVLLTSISISSAREGGDGLSIRCSDRLRVELAYRARRPLRRPRFTISINDYSNVCIYRLDSDSAGGLPEVLPPVGVVGCVTGPINIAPGQCFVNLAVFGTSGLMDHVQYAHTLTVEADDFFGTGKLLPREENLCLIDQIWHARAE